MILPGVSVSCLLRTLANRCSNTRTVRPCHFSVGTTNSQPHVILTYSHPHVRLSSYFLVGGSFMYIQGDRVITGLSTSFPIYYDVKAHPRCSSQLAM